MRKSIRKYAKRTIVTVSIVLPLLLYITVPAFASGVADVLVTLFPNWDEPTSVEISYTNGDAVVELFGNISDLGESVVESRGFVWSLSSYDSPGNTAPEAADYENFWRQEGEFGSERFSHLPQSLSVNTDYFGRAFIEVNEEFIYSENEVTFDPVLETSLSYSIVAVLPYVFVGICLVGATAFMIAAPSIASIVMLAIAILITAVGVPIIQGALTNLL